MIRTPAVKTRTPEQTLQHLEERRAKYIAQWNKARIEGDETATLAAADHLSITMMRRAQHCLNEGNIASGCTQIFLDTCLKTVCEDRAILEGIISIMGDISKKTKMSAMDKGSTQADLVSSLACAARSRILSLDAA